MTDLPPKTRQRDTQLHVLLTVKLMLFFYVTSSASRARTALKTFDNYHIYRSVMAVIRKFVLELMTLVYDDEFTNCIREYPPRLSENINDYTIMNRK